MQLDTPEARAIGRDLAAIWDDPVAFSRGVFAQDIWAKQEAMLRAIGEPNASVAVKGCHASAKTHAAARAALWFLSRFDDGIVVTTAPKEKQLELNLWKEIHACTRSARLKFPEPLNIELKISKTNYMVGLVAKDAERFQGFHAPHLLFIVEEAPGVGQHIFTAIEGARAGGDVRVLALGNPTIIGGPFYDAFTRHRARWATVSVSAFDTPNLQGLTLQDIQAITDRDDPRFAYEPAPYLATRRWVWEKWNEWGQSGSPLWDARVLGEFPQQGEHSLVWLSWIEQARHRTITPRTDRCHAGVDVAGPGECETVLCIRNEGQIILLQSWSSPDPRGEVLAALRPFFDRLESVNVDSNGIGYGLALHLQDHRYPVRFVNVGEKSSQPERFKNQKAEFYWGLRLRFEAGDIAGDLDDEKTVPQLAGLQYEHDAAGRVVIESKDDAQDRGMESPDRAEAIMLAFAPGASAPLAVNLRSEPVERVDWGSAP